MSIYTGNVQTSSVIITCPTQPGWVSSSPKVLEAARGYDVMIRRQSVSSPKIRYEDKGASRISVGWKEGKCLLSILTVHRSMCTVPGISFPVRTGSGPAGRKEDGGGKWVVVRADPKRKLSLGWKKGGGSQLEVSE